MAGAGCNPFLHKHAHGPTILFEVSLATVSHASSRLGQAQHETRQRHFVHIEVTAPDPDQAASITLLGPPIIRLSAHWRVRANLWLKITRQHQAAFLMCTW